MERDDFPKQTRDILALRVGVRCSNPLCRKLTTGPRTESSFILNIGVAAHITAATQGGPRFDSSLSSKERQSAENGIWLCQNCAKLIDNDPTRYSVAGLRGWKSEAERAALAEVEGNAPSQSIDYSAEIDITYSQKKITQQRHDYELQVILANRGTEPFSGYHIDLMMPAAVVSNPKAHPSYLPEKSTRDVAFFRVSVRETKGEIYPGDTKTVLSIPYYIDDKIYWGRYDRTGGSGDDLFNRRVKVIFYHYGFRPLTLERAFGDFQVF